MVPIYDTDIAEERWAQTEWHQYELWEKVEVRLKRRKRLWIAGTAILFLVLFSIPILANQKPKRVSLSAVRQLAQAINQTKMEAGLRNAPVRLRFLPSPFLEYRLEKVPSCTPQKTDVNVNQEEISSGRLGPLSGAPLDELTLLTPEQGQTLGIPGLVSSFCYDPITGSLPALQGNDPVGFALIPSRDLANQNFDRMSILVLNGSSAEISFE